MTVGSPDPHGFGSLRGVIPARTTGAMLRAAVCLVLAVLFVWQWLGADDIHTGLDPVRTWLPLAIPAAAVLAAGFLFFGTKNRFEIYERGLVYHTAFYELTAPWESVTGVSLEVDKASTRRTGPILVLEITFSDIRPWAFRSTGYEGLDTIGAGLVKQLAQKQAQTKTVDVD